MGEQRRERRTKADIEQAINEAAEKQISEKGFANVLLSDIIREAKIEPAVFYNRYANLDIFYTEFLQKYDYWVTDEILSEASEEPSAEKCKAIFNGLLDDLSTESMMREILRWEITEGNDTTNRMAMLREMFNMQLIFRYKKLFREKNSPMDITAFAALIIGGAYYLLLHCDRSTFCGLDLNEETDMVRIRKTIAQLTDMVFQTLDPPAAD